MKAIALSLGLAAMGLAADNLNAQSGGGLFGRGSGTDAGVSQGSLMSSASSGGSGFNTGGSGCNISTEQFGGSEGGGTGGFNIGTEQFGNEGPLGSGLFIMAAAGAAYAFSKKRKKQENN